MTIWNFSSGFARSMVIFSNCQRGSALRTYDPSFPQINSTSFSIFLTLSHWKRQLAGSENGFRSLCNFHCTKYAFSSITSQEHASGFFEVFAIYKNSSSKKNHPLYIIAVIRRFFELLSVFLRCERRKSPRLPPSFQVNY